MKPTVGFIGLGLMGKPMAAKPAEGGIPASGVESHGGASGRTGERGREAGANPRERLRRRTC